MMRNNLSRIALVLVVLVGALGANAAEIERSRVIELMDSDAILETLKRSSRTPQNQWEPLIHVSTKGGTGLMLLISVKVQNSSQLTIHGGPEPVVLKGVTQVERNHDHWILIDLVEDLSVSFPDSAKDALANLEIVAVLAR